MSPGEVGMDQPLSITEMVSHSGWMAKAVLVVLLLFSIISWAIILHKFLVCRLAKNEDGRFLAIFSKSESLTNIYNFARNLKYSPLARLFLTGYHELYLFQEMSKNKGTVAPDSGISAADLKGIHLALNKTINREVDRLSSRMEFLATTGSTTPFIGLFGTVWGIMHSFRVIGVKGSASIGGVAPGIAEALIATAAGLAAAIPAVVFYNYLSNKIQIFAVQMDDFTHDFLYMAEKNFSR